MDPSCTAHTLHRYVLTLRGSGWKWCSWLMHSLVSSSCLSVLRLFMMRTNVAEMTCERRIQNKQRSNASQTDGGKGEERCSQHIIDTKYRLSMSV